MTTSESTSFNMDIDEIITEAYERCGLEVRSGYDLKTARRSMNLMFSEWANRGINLWLIEERSKTLTASLAEYTLVSLVELPEVTIAAPVTSDKVEVPVTPSVPLTVKASSIVVVTTRSHGYCAIEKNPICNKKTKAYTFFIPYQF